MDPSLLLVHMKHFVKSTEKSTLISVVNDEPAEDPRKYFVSGTSVKKFYENTVGKEALQSQNKECKKDKTSKEVKLSPKLLKIAFNVNSLMKAVETGKIADVEEMLKRNNGSVNCTDQFGWTPMMSACCAGNQPMVQLLLRFKPNLGVRDKRGKSCKDLASARGHQQIVEILDQYIRDMCNNSAAEKKTNNLSQTTLGDNTPFYCKVCKQSVENTSMKKHLSSMIHNFHSASRRKMPTIYGIPESNKGFQILVRSGWNKEDGLGPSGEGHKYPPKTILKQDRSGLGAKQYKARVTHTLGDHGRKDVKEKKTFKKCLMTEKRREQRLERNIRKMLS